MRRLNWQIFLGFGLVVLSALIYTLHFTIFHDTHHIFIYLIGDIAFVPIEVLLVTLIIHRLLSEREKRALLKKMNMVIGTFFIEAGTELIELLSQFHREHAGFFQKLIINNTWTDEHFARISKFITNEQYTIESKSANLEEVKLFLIAKRHFLLRLLENPNLLEHDTFTDMLWAVFHLTDELEHRKQVTELSENDYNHLSGDMERAYVRLLVEWLNYMKHLKDDYPYLFSLAVRTNPFDPEVIVELP